MFYRKMDVIKIDGDYVEVAITPKELEGKEKVNPKTGKTKFVNHFKTYPKRVIMDVCLAYGMRYELEVKQLKGKITEVHLLIPKMYVDMRAYGQSKRKAMRRLALKLHYEYSERIVRLPKDSQLTVKQTPKQKLLNKIKELVLKNKFRKLK